MEEDSVAAVVGNRVVGLEEPAVADHQSTELDSAEKLACHQHPPPSEIHPLIHTWQVKPVSYRVIPYQEIGEFPVANLPLPGKA